MPSATLPRATEKKTAPLPQSQARLKLSRANVVSTTSVVSMNTSLTAIRSCNTRYCNARYTCHILWHCLPSSVCSSMERKSWRSIGCTAASVLHCEMALLKLCIACTLNAMCSQMLFPCMSVNLIVQHHICFSICPRDIIPTTGNAWHPTQCGQHRVFNITPFA